MLLASSDQERNVALRDGPRRAPNGPVRAGEEAPTASLVAGLVPVVDRSGAQSSRPGPGRSGMTRLGAEDDVFDPAVFARGVPHEALRRLRDEQPVAWQDEHAVGDWPAGPGFWAVTRYDDVRYVLRTPEIFSSARGATQIRDPEPEDLPFIRRMILNMDPPEHQRLRKLVTAAFTRRRLERFTDDVAARARGLLADGGRRRGVRPAPRRSPTTSRWPISPSCMGVPESDRHLLLEWTEPRDRLPGRRARAGRPRRARAAGEPAVAGDARRDVRLRGRAGRPQASPPRRRRHDRARRGPGRRGVARRHRAADVLLPAHDRRQRHRALAPCPAASSRSSSTPSSTAACARTARCCRARSRRCCAGTRRC